MKPIDESRSPLKTLERRGRIIELIAEKEFLRVNELSDLFQVSEVTICNDLDVLAGQGLLVRGRGGAIANASTSLVIAFDQRASLNLEEKRRIGRAAAQLVNHGETYTSTCTVRLPSKQTNPATGSSTHRICEKVNVCTLNLCEYRGCPHFFLVFPT